MKILMISSYLPYPLHSGGQIRLYNLIKELSAKHQITLICEKRSHQTQQDVKEMEKICKKVITVPRRKQWSLENIFKAAVSSHSFLITGHTHSAMYEKITQELAQEPFDLIHVETFYVMQNLPKTSLPVVLAEHNIEYEIYEKFKNHAPLFLRPVLSLDIAKIKREEQAFWKQATKVIAVSEYDQKVMKTAGIDAQLVANGVNIDQFVFKTKKASEQKKLLFIGDFKWLQNKDSLEFIIKDIWPKLKRGKNLFLWIVARNIPDSIKQLTNDPNIVFDEKSSVRPTPEIFQEADILLAPIRVGGGTSYKILESMSCGTPVVTMSMSAEAIGAEDEKDVMIGSTASELAEKTAKLLENKTQYETIAKNGRKLIEEKYSWKIIAQELHSVYTKRVNK